jgi:F0F1-type ATP synthase membrane subunit b/b'
LPEESATSPLLDTLKVAQDEIARLERLHEKTERECAAMLQSARAQAASIIAAAEVERDRINAWVKQFKDEVGPIAKSIVDA